MGAALVAAYVAAVAIVQATGEPDWERLASSPAQVADGQVWLLLSSGLVIDGLPWLQLAVLAAVLALAVRRLGGAWTCVVALAAHVGATLIAYAGVGLLWLGDRSAVAGTVDQPDYGVSVVLAGQAGALAATAPSRAWTAAIAATALAVCAVAATTSSALATAEHLLGFAIGAAIGAQRRFAVQGRSAEH